MNRLFLLAPILCCVFGFGCGADDGKSEFQGTATWNGEPIEHGNVEFHPLDNEGAQIDGAEIKNGAFTIRTTAGKKRVKVTAKKQVGMTEPTDRIPDPEPIYHQYIPPEFNKNTNLETTVGEGDVSLELTGKEVPQKKK